MGRGLRRRAGWRGLRGAGTRLRVLGAGSRCPDPLHPLRSQRALCRLALGRREQPGASPCLLLRAASIPDWPVWVRKPWRLALIWDGPEHLRDGLRPLSRPPRHSHCLVLPPSPDRPSPERAPREPPASPSPSQGQGAENQPTRGIKPSWASAGGRHPGSGGSLQASGAFRLNSNLFQQTQSGRLISPSPPASSTLDGPCRCWDLITLTAVWTRAPGEGAWPCVVCPWHSYFTSCLSFPL